MSSRAIFILYVGALLVLPSVLPAEVGEDTAFDQEGIEWINSLFYFPKELRVRKEYRLLSDEERNAFHTAFVMMKNDTSVKPNKYDLFVSLHGRRSSRNSAHKGPGFLPWHRVFLLLMENAMREQIPNVTIPYWDSTLDAILEQPRLSSVWSEDFIGNGDGYVVEGAFKSWTTVTSNLYRVVGNQEGPLADKNISILFDFKHIGEISMPRLPGKEFEAIVEDTHNRVHRWVGGEMFNIETAGQDPVFYIFHAFVDQIYEDFRAHQRANGIDPEADWDKYYGQVRHHPYSPMGLGVLMAIDGSSEVFAENIQYGPRPTCSREDPDCKTPYLYCNVVVEKCVPWTIREHKKIKKNAEAKFLSFALESEVAKEYKLSAGYEELNKPSTTTPATTTTDNDTQTDFHEDDGHSHDDDIEEEIDNLYGEEIDESHELEGEGDHFHVHEHHTEAVMDVIPAWREYTLLMIVGLLLAVRIILCTCTKCAAESRKRRKGTCKKYTMDGIVNHNYQEENEAKVAGSDGFTNRSDIYTVTVTCNDSSTIGSSTYVRFSRYIIGEKNKENKNKRKSIELLRVDNVGRDAEANYDIIENNIEKIKALEHKAMLEDNKDTPEYVNTVNTTGKGSANSEPKRNGVAEAAIETSAEPEGNYMDMTYASKIHEESLKRSDMFEKESEAGELNDDDDDDEERMNSFENENYELPIAATVNSFAFLDDYDNVDFVREPTNRDEDEASGSSGNEAGSIGDGNVISNGGVNYIEAVEHM